MYDVEYAYGGKQSVLASGASELMCSGTHDVCWPQRCIQMRDQDTCASSIQRSPPALLLQAMSMICLGCLQQIQGMPQVQVRLTLSEAIRTRCRMQMRLTFPVYACS